MPRTHQQTALALLSEPPAFLLQDRQQIAGILREVGLGIATAFDAATDRDRFRFFFLFIHYVKSIEIGLKDENLVICSVVIIL
jgi:hypothetical protein